MSNQKEIIQLIKSISGQANIIAIPRIFIDILDGDINAALLLSQIVYWSDKTKRTDGWFYKTYEDWHQEMGLSVFQVKRAVKALKKKKLIETKLKRANNAPTMHYHVNIGLITNLINNKLINQETNQSDCEETTHSDLLETDQSLTEITHKTTQRLTIGRSYFLDAFGGKRLNKVQKESIEGMVEKYGIDIFKDGVNWAAKQGMTMGRAIISLETALPKWGQPKTSGSIKVNKDGSYNV